jgi:hypothetical protein
MKKMSSSEGAVQQVRQIQNWGVKLPPEGIKLREKKFNPQF